MKRPWRREPQPTEPSLKTDPRIVELQTAKEILAEVFCIRPEEVEEMLMMRLERQNHHQEYRDSLWPATFSLGE